MQSSTKSMSVVAALLVAGARADESGSNPLGKVIDLMNDLTAKIKKDGVAEQKAYEEYFEWCDDASKNKQFEIKTATSQKEKLEATISELTANIEAADTKVGELAAAISTATADLKSATEIREKEAADFSASEAELVEAIDTMTRAVAILEKELAKNPAALAQVNNKDMNSIVQSLSALVDAASFPASDKQRLVALVQQRQQGQADADEDDEAPGAPAAAVYESKGGSIVDVISDMQTKAEEQLSDLRKAEKNAQHNYAMLKQSLEDQLSVDNGDMEATKKRKAADSEAKATAEGDLSVTTADLKDGQSSLQATQSGCMEVASDHEQTVASRDAELKVVAEAIKILKETTGGAVEQTYSLLQTQVTLRTHADLVRSEVLTMVKKLARQQKSPALAQLASRMSTILRYGAASGDDPFAKIKGMIQDMIVKLEEEASSEATEKAYCDEELSKSTAKKADLDEAIAKLSTGIDQATAKSTELKAEVKALQEELATMEKEQGDNTKWRDDEHAEYLVAKKDLEAGVSGVRKALDVLRNYYGGAAALVQQPAPPAGHQSSAGAGESIIQILEVCESDFASNLAKVETEESDAQETYDSLTQEYKIGKTEKDADVKYKTQEFTALDKSVSDLSSDRDTEATELAAVEDYLEKLKGRCVAKAESYEEKKARRDAEIKGLKEALNVLENEAAALLQSKHKKGRNMRGSLAPGL